MIRLTFPLYCQVTVALTALVIYHAHSKYEQFYPTGVYLATAKHALLTITNFAIVLAYLIGKLVIKIFLEKVHERELDLLNDKLKTSITDTILALTIFRDHFNAQFVFLLLILLFFQVFHWLTKYRVEYLEHSPYDFKKNVKLFTLLTILLFFDIIFLYFAIDSLFKHGINAMMLFSLEYGLLFVSASSTIISFFINIEGIKREGRWDQKGLYILYLEFFSEGIKTILYAMFFIVSLLNVGLPIHIIRQLFISFRTFYRRFQDLLQYQSIMNERFQDATDQELENSDKICIVCREDMTSGKKLPCGHILHLHCLRSWLERQQTCPICRALVIVDDPNRPVSLLNRIFRRRPPVQQPAAAPAAQPIVAQQQQQQPIAQHQALPQQPIAADIPPDVAAIIQRHQQRQAPLLLQLQQLEQLRLQLHNIQQQHQVLNNQQQPPPELSFQSNDFLNNNNNDNNFSDIPLSAPTTSNPLLQNDKDAVLHIMAMQNHIQFINSQLDYVKNYLITKNNNNNNNSNNNSSNLEQEGEEDINRKQEEENIEEIIGKPVENSNSENENITTTDDGDNNNSGNKTDEFNNIITTRTNEQLENMIIDSDEEQNNNIPTAVAEGDVIGNDKLINSPHTNPIIHDEQQLSNEPLVQNDFMEQLRKRVAKHKNLDSSNDE